MTVKTPATEEELLAMPAEDYMNDAQLEYFRQLLLNERKEVETTLEEMRGSIGMAESSGDDSDRAASEEELRYTLRQADRETRLWRKINATLDRIDEGDYGFCEETGEPIGLKRLLLRPTATLSIEAKQRQEQQENHYARRR
ncbi:RNA polymerase-binding protein DksA [Kushneria marisflavi]|uniref:RNA polymerase-binding protein DksA n=1 Tax=Kushneria marisflavi TaxID=157779 RepID=A0A240UPJ2_9GAMM|nr:RNA polymerase-binding protein DksA [Kushneria marisflavi]ART63035.1 RNA polymerase-binding protein DksA [Kushneria marisflavi]RKD84721.1 TraR/DksA family transcriptional regulator [Kushneria marisflavi]